MGKSSAFILKKIFLVKLHKMDKGLNKSMAKPLVH